MKEILMFLLMTTSVLASPKASDIHKVTKHRVVTVCSRILPKVTPEIDTNIKKASNSGIYYTDATYNYFVTEAELNCIKDHYTKLGYSAMGAIVYTSFGFRLEW